MNVHTQYSSSENTDLRLYFFRDPTRPHALGFGLSPDGPVFFISNRVGASGRAMFTARLPWKEFCEGTAHYLNSNPPGMEPLDPRKHENCSELCAQLTFNDYFTEQEEDSSHETD